MDSKNTEKREWNKNMNSHLTKKNKFFDEINNY